MVTKVLKIIICVFNIFLSCLFSPIANSVCFAGDIERIGPDFNNTKVGVHMDSVLGINDGSCQFALEVIDYNRQVRTLDVIHWTIMDKKIYYKVMMHGLYKLPENTLEIHEDYWDTARWNLAGEEMLFVIKYVINNHARYMKDGWNGNW